MNIYTAEQKNRVLSLLQSIVGVTSYFFVMREVVKILGIQSLGLWSLTVGLIAFIRIIDLSGASSVARLVALKKNDTLSQSRYIDTISLVGLCVFSLLCFIFFTPFLTIIYNSIDSELFILAKKLLLITFISLPINVLSMTYLSALDGLGRADIKSIINIISYISYILLSFSFITAYGLIGLAYAQMIQFLLSLILSRLMLYRYLEHLKLLPSYFNYSILRNSIGYIIRIQIFSSPIMLFDPLMRVLIARWYGLDFLGLYDLGYKIAANIKTMIQAYFNPIIPELSSIWAENKQRAITKAINYQKDFSWIIFISFASAIILSPLLSIILLGNINIEFLYILTSMAFSWGLTTLFLPINLLARASDTLIFSILGQILIIITAVLGFYIVSLIDVRMLFIAIVGLSIIFGNTFGFLGEFFAFRKKIPASKSAECISISIKYSIAFMLVATLFILFTIKNLT